MVTERFPNVSLSLDPQPVDTPFRITVELLNGFLSENPARILVSFENCSEREQTVGCGPIFPFSNVWCENCHLVLLPTDGAIRKYAFGTTEQIIPAQPTDGCWQTNLVHIVRNDVLRWQSIAGGETIETEYAVLHYPEQEIMEAVMDKWYGTEPKPDVCLADGTYRFEEEFLPRRGTKTSWNEFSWGFTLTLEK